ncbi:MAG: HAMP domain-containing histidine kinase [Planctomycetes bacterium]|nr:HAMP domain-containing histidine kinase [Planctomycetota bacterium]
MLQPAPHSWPVYALPPARSESARDVPAGQEEAALSEPLLHNSIEWFCRLRWAVVILLVLAGLINNITVIADAVGLVRVIYWPFICAGLLAAANLGFLRHARNLDDPQSRNAVYGNLWCQIVLDLLVLTVVVHLVGSTTTFIAFAYLFHIVVSCIFFPARLSLIVALLAESLFILCVVAEQAGLLRPQTIFSDPSNAARGEVAFDVASAVLIWTAVWHLTSHLAATVRQRSAALADANNRLLAAQEERAQYMLITTHQLKSPFAAIHAQAQLLLEGYCGPLGEQVAAVVQQITARCRRLTREIQEMLQLANLRSNSQTVAQKDQIDLSRLIRWCMDELEPIRLERDIRMELNLQDVAVVGVEDHFRMLLGNLLSNAITYSRIGGVVRAGCGCDADGCPYVTIADEGIGIEPTKLPRIFDEYYRTNEAVKHNPQSSGLGLAIVKQIAQLHGIQVRVESLAGAGTAFHLMFPRSCAHPAVTTS